MAECCNDEFNRIIYNFVSGCSLYAYLSHYFFIVVIVVVIVRPYKIGFLGAFFLVFFGTFLLIIITYIPLNFLYELIFPAKDSKKFELDVEEPEEGDEDAEGEEENKGDEK